MRKSVNAILLLICIPLYAACLYVNSLCSYRPFFWGDILYVSFFLLTAAAVVFCIDWGWKTVSFLCLHAVFFPVYYFVWRTDLQQAPVQRLLLYCAFCLPSLTLFCMIPGVYNEQRKKTVKKKSKTTIRLHPFGWTIPVVFPFVISAVGLLFSMNRSPIPRQIKFNGTGAAFFLFCLVFAVCLWRVSVKKMIAENSEQRKKRTLWFLSLLFSLSAANGFLHVFCFNTFSDDPVAVLFPLFLNSVFLFSEDPIIREAILPGTPKDEDRNTGRRTPD